MNTEDSKSEKIRNHYESRISDKRENYDILDWGDQAGQYARFSVLVDNVSLSGRRILDLGCGLGDLWAYMKHRNIKAQYTGVDIVQPMIQRASETHDDARFIAADVFAADCNALGDERFDIVFCSGMLNLDLGNNRSFLPVAIARMIELSREYIVFNLLHIRAQPQYRHCVYHDPSDMLEMLCDFPGDIRVIDDYLPNDFTLIMRKCPQY